MASDQEVIQLMEAKVHVFSDFVLCVWEKRINTRNRTPNEKEIVVQKYTAIPRRRWTRWRASGVRVENIPVIPNSELPVQWTEVH